MEGSLSVGRLMQRGARAIAARQGRHEDRLWCGVLTCILYGVKEEHCLHCNHALLLFVLFSLELIKKRSVALGFGSESCSRSL